MGTDCTVGLSLHGNPRTLRVWPEVLFLSAARLVIVKRSFTCLNNSNNYAAYPTYLNHGKFSVGDTCKPPPKSYQFFYTTYLSQHFYHQHLAKELCFYPRVVGFQSTIAVVCLVGGCLGQNMTLSLSEQRPQQRKTSDALRGSVNLRPCYKDWILLYSTLLQSTLMKNGRNFLLKLKINLSFEKILLMS